MNLLSNKPKWFKRAFSVLISVVLIAIILLAANYVAQRFIAHNIIALLKYVMAISLYGSHISIDMCLTLSLSFLGIAWKYFPK